MKLKTCQIVMLIGLLMICSTGWSYTASENTQIKAFLYAQFDQDPPKPSRLWVKGEMKTAISKILSRPSTKLNYRYWQGQGKTIWLLDELGKERDITTAVVVKNQQITEIKVVVYRESRGGEVQVPWFNEQFIGAKHGDNWQRNIDSISGATLSVNAMKKQATLALYLNDVMQELP